ncbi:hypothetical protein CC2G_000250 [Coprinopsis cinerea AmutBmut pab1-1]|nr:hypothetical protein CC2G_000250 [Coprinopsis cinerea AmutBmut pab1-1]
MSSELDRFIALGNASRRLVWEIYQSRNRDPRESLLILLEYSKIVKDYRKYLGLSAKTLDPPIRMLFAEIAKNHSTYLDKDVHIKPHIILDTRFLDRLPPLPPNFQPPEDVRPNEDVSMGSDGRQEGEETEDDEGHQRRSMKRDNTHMSPQTKRSKKKKVHVDDTATRPSTPAEEGDNQPPARATRSRTAKAGSSKGGSVLGDSKVGSAQGDLQGGSAQGKSASKGRTGGKEKEKEKEKGKGKGKGKEKEEEELGEEMEEVEAEAEAELGEPEDEAPAQQEPPAPGSGFELTDEPCALCVFSGQQYCWRPPAGACFRCRKQKQKCTFSKTTKGFGSTRLVTTAAMAKVKAKTAPVQFGASSHVAGPSIKPAEGSSAIAKEPQQVEWTVFGLSDGMPAGTAIDSSNLVKRDELKMVATATYDLQADVYDIRGQVQAKVDTDTNKFGEIGDRLEELEGDVEKVQEQCLAFTTDIDDIRAELEDLRKEIPNNTQEMQRTTKTIDDIQKRVVDQEQQFNAYKQKAPDRLRSLVQSTVNSEVNKVAGVLEGRLAEKLEDYDSRLRELEGQQISEMERQLEGLISEKFSHLFKDAEGKLENFVKGIIGKESQRLAKPRVHPDGVAKEVALSRMRSFIQEEVARVSRDMVQEAVVVAMRNLTVVPPIPSPSPPLAIQR